MKTLHCVLLMLAAGCGGSVVIEEADASRDAGSLRDARRDTGRAPPDAAGVLDSAAAPDSYVRFEEDACPNVIIEPPSLECDPFATPTGCGRGEGCYPITPRATNRTAGRCC